MSDQITIKPGFPPWQPGPDIDVIEVLNYYDMPLAGLLRQAGDTFFFWCLEGHGGEENLWSYVPVYEGEAGPLVEALKDGLSPEDALGSLLGSRELLAAVAREAEGVVSSVMIDQPQRFDSILAAAIDAFHSAEIDLEHLRASATG